MLLDVSFAAKQHMRDLRCCLLTLSLRFRERTLLKSRHHPNGGSSLSTRYVRQGAQHVVEVGASLSQENSVGTSCLNLTSGLPSRVAFFGIAAGQHANGSTRGSTWSKRSVMPSMHGSRCDANVRQPLTG